MNMRHKNDLTSLSASDIGRVVSLEWDGYRDGAWYIEGTLTRIHAEQEYITEYTLLGDEETYPATVSYYVRVSGWESLFSAQDAQHIIVSFPNLPVLDEGEVN